MTLHGSCHCGNITLELAWNGEPPQIPARACSCSFCTRHGGVWTSQPTARLAVRLADPSRVNPYAFGTRSAIFHVCSQCGVVPFVTSDIEGRRYAVVNVNALQDVDASWLHHAAANFDGEALDSRLARRQRNWIADVSIT